MSLIELIYDESKAEPQPKQKSKRDYAGIGAMIFTFFLIAIVTALTIYSSIEIAYGAPPLELDSVLSPNIFHESGFIL